MKPQCYVVRSRTIAARPLGGETMIMSAGTSTLFTLDEVATLIWDAADGVTPLDRIVEERVCAQYDVSKDVALRDAEALVENLAAHGILVLSDQPISSAASAAAGQP